MSGSAEKNKRKKYKKEIGKAAHGDVDHMIKENKDIRKENIRLVTRLGFFAIALGFAVIAALVEGVLLWIL